MNYADIVKPEEMRSTREWVKHTLGMLAGSQGGRGRADVACLRQGWGPFMWGRSVVAQPIRLAGKTYDSGFGTHVESHILVTLSRPGARLTGLAGCDDNQYTRETPPKILFSVEVEGKSVWASGGQSVNTPPARVDADLKGAKKFTLKSGGDFVRGHADWADLKVTFADGSSIPLGERLPFVSGPAFSFTYDGKRSQDLLDGWKLKQEPPTERGGVRSYRLVWTDPKTGLACILELKESLDFPVVEWVLRFKNTGKKPTPILEDIRSMDLRFETGPELFLNYQDGDYCIPDSYQPHRVKLTEGTQLSFAPEGGRPTNRAWPYYNVECPKEQSGAILVVGWSAQWASQVEFTKTEKRFAAGQEKTHFKLMPGEEVRTPMSVVMLWKGDRVRSQNLWRRWMLAHNVPRPGGKLPDGIFSTCMGLHQSEKGEKEYIDAYLKHGVKFDYWWMDAGWYPTTNLPVVGSMTWWRVGTWKPDPARFPRGIRAVADHVHKKGMKLVLWFEPERVTEATEIDVEHPELLLSLPGDSNKLLNLGNPAAWKWLLERLDSLIVGQGIDLYRQDHNFDPLPFWRANDEPDRQGINEIRYVEGYLALWDELRRRHPDMLIDSCASGGRRNDIETLRRSVPLLRSDYQYQPSLDRSECSSGNHGHTYGLSPWFPHYGTGIGTDDIYMARSHFSPSMGFGLDPKNKNSNWKQYKRVVGEWKRIAPYFFGDFYPLTAYNIQEDGWMGWQFHRPDLNGGFVQFFRHSQSPFVSASFKLFGLDAETTYSLTDMDKPRRRRQATGKELMETGLPVELGEAPKSMIVVYEKCAPQA